MEQRPKHQKPLRKPATVCAILLAAVFCSCCNAQSDNTLRVLYWNIQNGMWSDQENNYDNFVNCVEKQKPDLCIWAEAQSNYKTGTADKLEPADRYLIENWKELSARYGHGYLYVGGHRDNYPQVITSKYPIENVERIVGSEPDSVVTHGCGWARIEVNGHTVNLVSVHLWPQAYSFRAADTETSRAGHGGDMYRRMEIEYIYRHTLGRIPEAEGQLWLMAGDFNSRARTDNGFYEYPEDDTRLLVHDYIRKQTPYVDVIAEKYPGEFKTSTHGQARIDYIYCTRPLYDRILWADILLDDFTKPVRDGDKLSNFYHPSDHLPIMAEFDIKKK